MQFYIYLYCINNYNYTKHWDLSPAAGCGLQLGNSAVNITFNSKQFFKIYPDSLPLVFTGKPIHPPPPADRKKAE